MLAGLVAEAEARAQTPPPKVFNLYVKPTSGDDAQASARNPNPSVPGGAQPLAIHPSLHPSISGQLQHAPYAFRTVTAATKYLYEKFLNSPGGVPIPLPANQGYFWRNPNDPNLVIREVIIHCETGLYGPTKNPLATSTDDEFDPRSGLPWNGETFPIQLPERVSIQGTSALDTIFDARGYDAGFPLPTPTQNVFQFGGQIGTSGGSEHSFIDSIAIRGCRADGSAHRGAAILIDAAAGSASPRITNCMIYGNEVGIAIFNPVEPTTIHHRPWVVNNTLAWNHIGIYSGSLFGAWPTFADTGYAEPILLNNLIDAVRPTDPGLPPYLQNLGLNGTQAPSCFEGIADADVTASVLPVPGEPSACSVSNINWNAYQKLHVNTGAQWPFGQTQPRHVVAQPTPPQRDLGTWLGTWNGGNTIRGDLFVRDVLRRAGLSCAPHDFRLAPMVRRSDGGLFLNPLVNAGIVTNYGTALAAWNVTFANVGLWQSPGAPSTQTITSGPGITRDGDALFDAWDWDCEGVGNPRIAQKLSGFLGTAWSLFLAGHCESVMDLGADEMGELIISGFLDSTRTFTRAHASVALQTGNFVDCRNFYFLNVVAMNGSNPLDYPAPQFNLRIDEFNLPPGWPSQLPPNFSGGVNGHEWYVGLGPFHNPYLVYGIGGWNDPPIPYAYTSGQYYVPDGVTYDNNTVRFLLNKVDQAPPQSPPTQPYGTFMRTRVCDIGPHILDDTDVNAAPALRDVDWAEHAFYHARHLNARRDIFACNAWHDNFDQAAFPDRNDNIFLYVNGTTTRLREGTLNPPLTVFKDPFVGASNPKSYLFRDGGNHQISFWNPPAYAYTVGSDGLSAAQPLNWILNQEWIGYRINFELFDPDNPLWSQFLNPKNNLQTALVVLGEGADGMAAPENEQTRSARVIGAQRMTEVMVQVGRNGRARR